MALTTKERNLASMKTNLKAAILLLLVATFAVTMSATGQDKKEDKKDPPTKIVGVLPANWGKLGLSDDQKQQVYKLQKEYKDKIDVLEKQIKALKEEERMKREAVLTDEQKQKLKDILSGKFGEKKDDKKE